MNHCPTYRVLGTEMDSPRGRIYQVLQVDEGKLEIGEPFVTHIDRCLGCLACETACPSGVQYGQIVERARAQIETQYRRGWAARMARWFFFRKALRDFHVLSKCGKILRFYQRSGLQWLARKSGLLRLLGLAEMERLTPEISDDPYFNEIGTMVPAEGERRGRVLFHAGCVTNIAFAELNRATAKLLGANGIEVFVYPHQRCCGALHAHSGFREDARLLAKRNIQAVLEAGGRFDAIITNSAGCGSHMKDYAELLKADGGSSAKEFAAKVKDVTEYLAEIGLRPPRRKLGKRVIYQDACHLLHAQKIKSAPRELLRAAGAEVVELPHPEQCCGSAGSYNVSQTELSMQILDRKMEDVAAISGEMVVTGNTGCQLQLRVGMERKGLMLPVRHIVEVLGEMY